MKFIKHNALKTVILNTIIFAISGNVRSADPIVLTVEGTSVTRGDSASLTASVTGGCPPFTFEWSSWSKGNHSATKTGKTISAKVLETCSVHVIATDSTGETDAKTVTITVNDRAWNTVHTVDPDSWTNWGSFPFTPTTALGTNRNSNTGEYYPLVGEVDGNWDDFITRVKITDSNGPFNNCWYNSTHNLRVERETRINQYLKGVVGSVNWPALQNNFVANPGIYSPVSASDFVEGVKYHENQGKLAADFTSNPKTGGHSSLMKKKQDSGEQFNAAKVIEKLYSFVDESDLKAKNNSKITTADFEMILATSDAPEANGGLSGNLNSDFIINLNSTGNIGSIDQ